MEYIFGGGGGTRKQKAWSPEQQQFMQQLFSFLSGSGMQGQTQGFDVLRQYMDPNSAAYQQNIEQPIKQQYEQQMLPMLTERFAGGAQGGALSSSGFGQALSAGQSDLSARLAQLRAQTSMGAAEGVLGNFGGLSSMFMGSSPYNYQGRNSQPGMWAALPGFLRGW